MEQSGWDLEGLRRMAVRPPLDAPHVDRFWDDPHISRGMLAAHLDPTTDAASRRPEAIDRTVDWLVAHLGLRPGQAILDMGCGPGLYCARLRRRGLRVTGMDFSRNSIEYARARALEEGLDIEYVHQDYLTLDRVGEFDAAIMIYLDFGVLAAADRDELLRRVHRALRPDGAFAFDVAGAGRPFGPDGEQSWDISAGGFWKPGPHLTLTQAFRYPEAEAELEQVLVVEESGRASLYRIWEHRYSPATIGAALDAQGLRLESVWGDLTGAPYRDGSPVLGVVARL